MLLLDKCSIRSVERVGQFVTSHRIAPQSSEVW
jgi:hypothetical protein